MGLWTIFFQKIRIDLVLNLVLVFKNIFLFLAFLQLSTDMCWSSSPLYYYKRVADVQEYSIFLTFLQLFDRHVRKQLMFKNILFFLTFLQLFDSHVRKQLMFKNILFFSHFFNYSTDMWGSSWCSRIFYFFHISSTIQQTCEEAAALVLLPKGSWCSRIFFFFFFLTFLQLFDRHVLKQPAAPINYSRQFQLAENALESNSNVFEFREKLEANYLL
jgi:hypothetical protein